MSRLIFTILIFLNFPLHAQVTDTTSARNTKPGAGLNYHLQLNHIDIAPFLNIPLTERLYSGFGLNVLHYYRGENYLKGKNAYGANIFVRYFATPKIFLHGEYLYGSTYYLYPLLHETSRVKEVGIFAGGGYSQPFSDLITGYIFFLMDLNHSDQSIYRNKFLLKVGVTVF